MTRRRFPGAYASAQAIARALGWITTVATVVILGFIASRWPDKGGAIAAGIVGSVVALLNDSWIVVATADRSLDFPPMSPTRALLHDLFSLAICLGGIVMIIFSRYTYEVDGFALTTNRVPAIGYPDNIKDGFSENTMLSLAVWILATIVIWRFIFVVWGLFDCFTQFRRLHARQQMIQARTATLI